MTARRDSSTREEDWRVIRCNVRVHWLKRLTRTHPNVFPSFCLVDLSWCTLALDDHPFLPCTHMYSMYTLFSTGQYQTYHRVDGSFHSQPSFCFTLCSRLSSQWRWKSAVSMTCKRLLLSPQPTINPLWRGLRGRKLPEMTTMAEGKDRPCSQGGAFQSQGDPLSPVSLLSFFGKSAEVDVVDEVEERKRSTVECCWASRSRGTNYTAQCLHIIIIDSYNWEFIKNWFSY